MAGAPPQRSMAMVKAWRTRRSSNGFLRALTVRPSSTMALPLSLSAIWSRSAGVRPRNSISNCPPMIPVGQPGRFDEECLIAVDMRQARLEIALEALAFPTLALHMLNEAERTRTQDLGLGVVRVFLEPSGAVDAVPWSASHCAAAPRAGNHTPSADPGEPGCKLAAFLRGRPLRCPRESASVVARARSCWRWCSSSKSREFATCSHFLSAAARVGGRSTRSEPSRVCVGTARSFGVECALNAKVSTIRLFANSGKGHDVRITC
jgi:hypothetical protein